MSLLKRITSISQARHVLENGILVLLESRSVNGEAGEEKKIRRVYLSDNPVILASLKLAPTATNQTTETFTAYDLVRREPVTVRMAFFAGFVYSVASTSLADNRATALLALDKPCRRVDKHMDATLIDALEDTRFCYVYAYGSGDEKMVINVDEHGFNPEGDRVIENAEPATTLEHRDGYLVLGKKIDPLFVAATSFNPDDYSKKCVVFPATGYVKMPECELKHVVVAPAR